MKEYTVELKTPSGRWIPAQKDGNKTAVYETKEQAEFKLETLKRLWANNKYVGGFRIVSRTVTEWEEV